MCLASIFLFLEKPDGSDQKAAFLKEQLQYLNKENYHWTEATIQ